MDQDLKYLRAAQSGNANAFRYLAERHKDYVYTLAFRVVKNRETAEEIAQDVFVKMYKNLSSFRGDSKLTTWLYTLTYRTAIDYARKRNISNDSIDRDDRYFELKDSSSHNPEVLMERQERSNQIKKVIDRLKPDDAALITMFYFNDKNIDEITEITGLSRSNVKVRLFRLREVLRKELVKELQIKSKEK